ncbi:MAG: histidine phosphatase family protein [Burkholderiales bacterium]|nr:histidine phosphatase family protein [Sulfuricellaceae bacterium]
MDFIQIDLMRHGEPQGGRRYRGQIDDPLSEKGWQQMRDAVGDRHPWQHIVSSPLLRCAEFAHELSERWDIPCSEDHRFMEFAFGEWEGKTTQQLTVDDPDRILKFRLDPIRYRPAGAEALDSFASRIASAWRDVLGLHQGKQVLLVAHAGVIRVILAQVLGMPLQNMYRIEVGNASISRVRVEPNEMLSTLVFHDGRL